jgi:Uma2 family endonuclease
VIAQPFVMRLPEFPNRRREPDLLIVLKDNPNPIKGSYIDGPADIVIEIVSEESVERDRGEKFIEYETGRVEEHWLLDYLREEAQFYRRSIDRFVAQPVDANQQYRTPLLPDFALDIGTLWRDPLPKPSDVGRMVSAMLGE